jgi:hypothetical protein
MEMAAVLYLAESKREKGDSQFLKKTDEKLVFISKASYPIWLTSYNNVTLLFDGLGLASHTISIDEDLDIEIFNKDIQRNQKTSEAYTAALTRNIDYFSDFQGKEDLRKYLPQMKEMKKSPTTKVLIKPTIKTREIQASLKQLNTLRQKIDKDIKNMDAGMRLLNTTTTQRVKAIQEEIKRIRKMHHKKIQKTKLTSTRRLQQIQNLYNRKIARTSKKYKKRLLRLNKNQVKHKKALKNLRKEAKKCETRQQYSRRHKRKRSERQWSLSLERIKKKLSTLRKQIKANTKRIHDAENAQKFEVAKQRIKCCARIESANKKFRDLQGSKHAIIIMKRQEIATLENVTSYITKSMQEIAQRKKLFKAEFDGIAVPQGRQACRLVYMPFYLVRYEKGDKKRYNMYPPSVIRGMGILTKMKGALGATKVKALLQNRSEALATFLNQLLVLFEKKPMLEKNVTEAGIRNSILLRKKLRLGARKGLEELENGNWISENELRNISKLLFIYSSSMSRRTKTLISENDYLMCIPT